ncbi:MAG: proline--tRNA ligase, partial [Candidatus Omnitrophica bacterium]|nr:proline--tRNA ligase [Candidatus Omnitrophota bacterium]
CFAGRPPFRHCGEREENVYFDSEPRTPDSELKMRWTQYFIPTVKETPQEAQIKSHRLMLRAGLVRKLASGAYSYLPLGLRALKKAEAIVREEMDRAGALEVLLPAIHPVEIWRESGRLEVLGEDMIHFKDRHGKENVLGPTHEEVITDLVRREIRSYKQLPVTFYQIQTKFRDELRPRSGVIRSREFLMKDAYSFHDSDKSLDETYQAMKEAYRRIFSRCGLDFYVVQADPGAMGGSGSQEFVLFSDAGEDWMAQVGDSDTVVSVEMASRKLKSSTIPNDGTPVRRYRKVHTPGHSSAESVATTLKTQTSNLIKTMIYQNSNNEIFAVLVRGDHEVSEFKIKTTEPGAHLAPREIIDQKSAFGFTGPLGLKDMKFYIDEDVLEMKDFVVGANEAEQHFVGMNWEDILFTSRSERDRVKIVGDFRQAVEGDLSPEGKPLKFRTAIELGHIFKLNLRYSVPLKAQYLNVEGKLNPLIMGCYGIGVNRILAAAIEQHADDKGIVWPRSISPFQAHVVMLDPEDAQSRRIVEEIEGSGELKAAGVDILVDDRKETAGVKFNDADLIGIPLRVILGQRNLKLGKAELKIRKTAETRLVDTPVLVPAILETLNKL